MYMVFDPWFDFTNEFNCRKQTTCVYNFRNVHFSFFLSFTWMLHHLHMLKTFQEISFQWCLWENLRHYKIFNIKETSQRLVFNVFIRNFWTWEHFQRWNNFRKFSILLVKFSCRKFKTQQWMFVLFCFD